MFYAFSLSASSGSTPRRGSTITPLSIFCAKISKSTSFWKKWSPFACFRGITKCSTCTSSTFTVPQRLKGESVWPEVYVIVTAVKDFQAKVTKFSRKKVTRINHSVEHGLIVRHDFVQSLLTTFAMVRISKCKKCHKEIFGDVDRLTTVSCLLHQLRFGSFYWDKVSVKTGQVNFKSF